MADFHDDCGDCGFNHWGIGGCYDERRAGVGDKTVRFWSLS
jgi:hypothetical protein